ncbi:hypothetical protein CANINC_004632 [Pichia inconspicua]|uniref:F-box domain-containing protein n=1 Tax=Pichia inconspicua TaxID=52247 RepID=A0A4T0WVU3_9ASCO|nr:hypothetical protein CANINC_004632 [[Candida] inconspicua]
MNFKGSVNSQTQLTSDLQCVTERGFVTTNHIKESSDEQSDSESSDYLQTKNSAKMNLESVNSRAAPMVIHSEYAKTTIMQTGKSTKGSTTQQFYVINQPKSYVDTSSFNGTEQKLNFDMRSIRSKKSENFDFIRLQLSSDDDIDYRNRFEAFFGIEYAVSSCAESITDSAYGNEVLSIVDTMDLLKHEESMHLEEQLEEDERVQITDSPPPYSETIEQSTSSFMSSNKTADRNKDERVISVPKESNNQLKDGTKEVYQLDKYLPPYRSLLNPGRVYDYRTNAFINSPNIIAIFKGTKKSKRIASLIIRPTTNLDQVIKLDDDSTTENTSDIEYKTKPDAAFDDLPEKIVGKVINLLEQRELVNMLYVSKKINYLVNPKLYHYPRFTSTYRVAQFVHTIMNNSNLAGFVKVLDFSKIELPITLTPAEKVKYQDNLIYGINNASEVLCGTNKIIHAGWRDWKFRNSSKYSNSKRARSRSSSVSTLSSTTSLPNPYETDVFTNNYSSKLKRYKTMNNVSDLSQNKLLAKKRSMSTSNLRLYDEGFFKSMMRVFDPWRKKPTREKNNVPPCKKVKQNNSIQKKSAALRKHCNTVTFAVEEPKHVTVPFSTPHPAMQSSLRQYCFKRDLPVGFIIHLFEECINLEKINFEGTVLSSDYRLHDYKSFDWKNGTGVVSQVLEEIEGRPIFWSDTERDVDVEAGLVENGIIEIMEIHNIWEPLLKLKNVKVLNLSKFNSIEQKLVSRFLFESEFSDSIMKLHCRDSGMVKRTQWEVLETASEWKNYFLSK